MQTHVQEPMPAKAVWGTLIAVTLARIAFGYQIQTVASIAPNLVVIFRIELAVIGTLMGLYLLPGIGVAIPYGFLGRRFGEFWVLVAGLLLMAAGSLVSAAAAGPSGIGVGRVIAGAGAVAVTVMQGKVAADRFRGTQFIHAMGLVVGAYPIGVGLAQLTQSRLAESFGWQASFAAGAVVALAAVLVLVTTWQEADPERRRSLRWPGGPECALAVIAGLIWTAYNAGYFNFVGYMPTYLAFHGHPKWEADVVISIATWGNLPAILLGGALATRLGQTNVFVFGSVLNSASVLGLYLADWPIVWGALFGTLASVHAGIIVAKGTLSARPENRAVGMALFYTTYYIGGFLIPPLCGRVADLIGDPSGAYLCAGTISALAIPLFLIHAWLTSRFRIAARA